MRQHEARTTHTYGKIFARAWPIMIANSVVPLLGIADTAVIGRTGSVRDLGAIALGALVFSFVYWTFGFLRMGTTGFVAQASGAGKQLEVRVAVGRALLMALLLGAGLVILQLPVAWIAFSIRDGSAEVETIARQYVLIRIWGAPAALTSFAISGALIGLGRSRTLLALQVFTNGLNIALDVLFAGVYGWGTQGIAAGTLIAEWSAAVVGGLSLLSLLRAQHDDSEPFMPWRLLRNAGELLRTLRVHADIMIRTLLMLIAFGWFTQQGARMGEATLAANHVLLQFIFFSAFFLDGYAFATESLVGAAIGARDRCAFDEVVRRSSVLAGITGLLLGLGWWLFGESAIEFMTHLPAVQNAAIAVLPYAALYVAVSAAAFQLDGIFIGATRTREMRNASLYSFIGFIAIGLPLVNAAQNLGLWVAFIAYVVLRAITLWAVYPRLRSEIPAR